MDKKIKDLIAEKKLSDEDIYALLTAETQPADEEDEENNDDGAVETDSTDEQEDQTDEEDVSDEEQPDVRSLIREMLAEELGKMKRGKSPPKIVKKAKIEKKPKKYNYNQEFGAL